MAKKQRYLTEEQVADALGIGASTLHRLIENGEFPDGFNVSERAKRWYQRDVEWYAWGRMRLGERWHKPIPPEQQKPAKKE